MNWYEQASDVLKSLSQVPDGMILDWMKFVSAIPQSSQKQATATLTPMWRAIILQSIRDMDDNIDPTAKNVMHKLLASQLTTMRLIETAMQTWQAIAPKIQNREDWRPTLDEQLQRVRYQMQHYITEGVQSLDNMEQLWEKYLAELRNLGLPWFNSTQMGTQYYERLLRGDTASLVEMTSIYSDAFQDSFSSLLNIPNMGNTRKIDESMRKNFSSWVALQKASYDYQAVVVDAWLEAFGSLMHELALIAEQGEMLDTIRDFLNRWSALADETFKQTFHAEQYIRLQSAFVNAVMQYRKTQALMNEVIMEFYDMPTRSEIDEAHRRIYELQKELRALKREIALLKADKADKDC